MAASRFALELDKERKRLCEELVESLTGLPAKNESVANEVDAENAAIAVDFCVQNLEQPKPSNLWKSPADMIRFYISVVEKLRVHSEHAKAQRITDCIKILAERSGLSEDLFVSLLHLFHLLSNAPIHNDVEKDAQLLLNSKTDIRVDIADTSELMEEIRARLSPLKSSRGQDFESESLAPVDQDWLDERFSDGSESSFTNSSDEEEDEDDICEEGICKEDVKETGIRKGGREEDKLETFGASDSKGRPKEEKYFFSVYEEGLLKKLSQLENLTTEKEILSSRNEVVHETELLRSILVSLNGSKHNGALYWDSHREIYTVSASYKVTCAHLSTESVAAYLGAVCMNANNMHKIRRYCKPQSNHLSLVEQNLREACRTVLHSFESAFTAVEEQIKRTATDPATKEIRAPTLLSTMCILRPTLDKVTRLASCISQIMEVEVETARDWGKETLEMLFELALDEILEDQNKTNLPASHCPAVVLHRPFLYIFFKSLEAQINIITTLLESAKLLDPFDEFFITLHRSTTLLTENRESICALRGCMPNFWLPVADMILQGARSIRTLRTLCLNDPDAKFTWPPESLREWPFPPLLEIFTSVADDIMTNSMESSNLYAFLSGDSGISSLPCELLLRRALFSPIERRVRHINYSVMTHVLQKHRLVEQLETVRNLFFIMDENLLNPFLIDLFHAVDKDIPVDQPLGQYGVTAFIEDQETVLSRIPKGTLCPSNTSLATSSLSDTPSASDVLTQILNSDFDEIELLRDKVTVEWKIEEINSKGTSFTFGERNSREEFADSRTSNTMSVGRDLAGIHALDCLRLQYLATSPLSTILDASAIQMYESIFRLLLQIKRTRYILCQVQHIMRKRMLQLANYFECSHLHKLSLEVAEHLHFVNNLHAYIMHRLVHSPWDVLRERAKECSGLEQLREIHHDYLSQVCTQCMISPENPRQQTTVMQPVLELLDASIKFRLFLLSRLYATEPRATHRLETQLSVVHRKFSRSYRFLLIMLSQRSSIGGVKHLDDVLTRLDFNQSLQKPSNELPKKK